MIHLCWLPAQAWAPPLQQMLMDDGQFSAVDGSALPAGGNRPSYLDSRGGPGEREDFSKDPRFADQQLPQTMLLPLRTFTFLRLTQEMTSPAYQVRPHLRQLLTGLGICPLCRCSVHHSGMLQVRSVMHSPCHCACYRCVVTTGARSRAGPNVYWFAPQGAWLRFMYRMQTSQATSQYPEPHLGLRPWVPPPQPPPKRSLARQQSAPSGGGMLGRQSPLSSEYGRSSEGNLNRAAE